MYDYHIDNRDGELRFFFVVPNDKREQFEQGDIIPTNCESVDKGHTLVKYVGSNAIDIMMKTFDNIPPYTIERYMSTSTTFLPFRYTLTDDAGVAPTKTRQSDSGFDLTLVAIRKTVSPTVTLFGTGVSVEPPAGYYFDMVPRSSMIKTGYMLANSVGIIDQGYTGEIMVPLIKLDPSAPDLELPCRMVQLIPRRWYGFRPENSANELTQTNRGSGGFGSTNI